MKSDFRVAVTIFVLLFVAACSTPSGRKAVELPGPNGKRVTCFEPPVDVVASGGSVKASADIPKVTKVIEALKVSADANVTYQRIRSEVPDLQTVETVEFRLCTMHANGIVTPDQYQRFLSVLPLLKSPSSPAISSPSPPAGTAVVPSNESVRTPIGRNFAVSADGCRNAAQAFTLTSTGALDTTRGGQGGAPMGFDFVITGNNSHGVRNVSVSGNEIRFTLHAEGRGTDQGMLGCVGAEGANAAADVYAWIRAQ